MDESPQVLRYVTEDPDEKKGGTPTQQVMNGLTWAILIVCLAFWAVVGAIFWIPLLLRTMFRFSVALVQSMLAGKKPERAARMLRDAVNFYRRGFQVATEVVLREPEQPQHRYGVAEEDPGIRGMALVNEIAWVAAIWYGILFFFGVVEATPLDLWRWLVGIDWTETVVRPLAEWVRGLRN